MADDDGVGIFVLDAKAAGKKLGNTAVKSKTSGVRGGDNELSWQSLALLVASLLVLFFGASLWYPRTVLPVTHHHHHNHHVPSANSGKLDAGSGTCDTKCKPVVTCQSFGSLDELKSALVKINCPGGRFSLSVKNSSIGSKLERNWLPESVHLNGTLTLDSLDLEDFADDAFQGAQLEDVTTIVLSNLLNVTVLRRDIFRNLNKLEGIRLENLNGLKEVENGIVSKLARFHDLEFTSNTASISELIPSFTGPGNDVRYLVKVIYAGNIGTLRADHLKALNLNGLTMLNLQGAGITAVESGTLNREADGVQLLNLMMNNLTTISADAINITNFPNGLFYLAENPWDCTCPLAWLTEVKDHIKDDPVCATPSELEHHKIKNLTYEMMCPPGTGTPTTEEPPTTEQPSTTEEPPTTITTTTTAPPVTTGCKESHPEHSEVESIRILTEIDQGKVLVTVPRDYPVQRMEWSGNDGKCYWVDATSSGASFVVSEGLRPGASYTFCFLEGAAVVIGRCFPITLLPAEESRAWLTNGDMPLAIALVVAVSLAAMACAVCLVWALLRHRPALLGKHVVVVTLRREEDTVLAMPRHYRRRSAPSDDGATYITPQRPTACQYANYYARRLVGRVFFRRGGDPQPPVPRRTSSVSTVTSDEGDLGAGRRWSGAPGPTANWVRRPDFQPWGPSRRPAMLQEVRTRGVSATSGI